MVTITGLTKRFGDRVLLDHLTLTLPSAGFVGITGPSGCGKTTLLSILGGFDRDFSGSVSVVGFQVNGSSEKVRCAYRQKSIGFVFQDFRLFPLDTVENNVLLPLAASSSLSVHLQKKKVADLLDIVGLSGYQKHLVTALSGGEKQRVALARALVNDPQVILADEPTGALDEKNGLLALDLLKKISMTKLVIIVSHEKALLEERADVLISFQNQEIKVVRKATLKQANKPLPILRTPYASMKSRIPLLFSLKHALTLLKLKRWRTATSDLATSLGLLGVGLAILLSTSIGTRIKKALTEVIGEDKIIMTLKNPRPNLYYDTFAAPMLEMQTLESEFSDFIDGVGVTYQTNFEDFFQDGNELVIASTIYKAVLPSFSVRLVNDYIWLSEIAEEILPFRPPKMENDEIILGLPFEDMLAMCTALKIHKNYSSLTTFISENDLLLSFNLLNESWSYEDEQIVQLVGFFESETPLICHDNRLWNEWMFETAMRFPVSDNLSEPDEHPWVMKKVPYFHTADDPSLFLNVASTEAQFNPYILERVMRTNDDRLTNRVLAFITDKNAINLCDLTAIQKSESALGDYVIGTSGGYAIYPSALMMGFARECYFSPSFPLLEETIDLLSVVSPVEQNAKLVLPKGILMGDLLQTGSENVRFSANQSGIVWGRKTETIDEIVISRKMAEKFYGSPLSALGKTLFTGITTGQLTDSLGTIRKTFAEPELQIVGIVDSSAYCLYQDMNWSLSFFRDLCGISAFNLMPNAVAFDLADGADSETVLKRLNHFFPVYAFSNPAEAINSSVDLVTGYAEKALLAFSVLAILVSSLLMGLVIYLFATENRHELIWLRALGIPQGESQKLLLMPGYLLATFSFLSSALELALLQVAIEKVLDEVFRTSFSLTFSFIPFLAMGAVAAVIAMGAGYAATGPKLFL